MLGTISAFAYRHRETRKNLCRDGRSQDLPNTEFWPAVGHLKYNKYISLRRSRKLTVWNTAYCEMIQNESEDMRTVMPCWYYGKVEHCIRQGVAYLHPKTPKGHFGAYLFCLIHCYIYLLYRPLLASCTMGTGSFPGVNCGRGVLLTTNPLLVPWSWKSRAIPQSTLWATADL